MKKLFAIFLSIASAACAATSVARHGITWTFNADYTVGQYANGDYYVVAPSGLTITGISPASTNTAGRIINGSMVNPVAGQFAESGFDTLNLFYDAALNVARPGGNDLSAGNPLVLAAGSSLVSSVSFATSRRPQLTDAAVLTVVSSAPASGSFRPPYCGTEKTHYWNKTDLNYGLLRNLAAPAFTPTLATQAAAMSRVWIEIDTAHSGRYMHPSNNQPDYGRDLASVSGIAMLLLHLNASEVEKEALLVNLVQYGLDVYGSAVSGGHWVANGGHNVGRKAPMLFAGLILGDSAITAYADKTTHFIFQEDQQAFVVAVGDVGKSVDDTYISLGRQRLTYTTAMIGLPEWGIEHANDGSVDGSNWNAIYRNVNYGVNAQHALAMQLTTGAKAAWNWNPYFDFIDRAVSVDPSYLSSWTLSYWNSHRALGAALWSPAAPVPAPAYIPVNGLTIRTGLTSRASIGAGGSGGLAITASGGAVSATYSSISATEIIWTLSRTIGTGETVTVAYTQPGNGIENPFDGQDVANFTGLAVVNYSTASGGTDVTAPTASPVTIDTLGLSASVLLSENGQVGAGGSGGFAITMSGGPVTLAFVSLVGNAATFTLSRRIADDESGTYTYTQPGSGFEDLAGNDLASIAATVITNNSEYTELTTYPYARARRSPVHFGTE